LDHWSTGRRLGGPGGPAKAFDHVATPLALIATQGGSAHLNAVAKAAKVEKSAAQIKLTVQQDQAGA
jgi:hypothetical protein